MSIPRVPPRGWQERYIGCPFLDGGTDPKGWDCFGLVWWCLTAEFGYTGLNAHIAARLPDAASACREERLSHQTDVFTRGIAPGRGWRACERRSGAAVLIGVRGRPIHVGLVLVGGLFLHVDRKTPTCVEALSDGQWANRILGYYEPA